MYQAIDRDEFRARLMKSTQSRAGNPAGYVHPFFSGSLRKQSNAGSSLTSTLSPQGRISNSTGQKGGQRNNSFLNKNAVGMVSNTPPKPTQVSMEAQTAIANVHKNLRSGQVQGLTPKRGLSSARFNMGQPKVPTATSGSSNVKMALPTPRVKASSAGALKGLWRGFRSLGRRGATRATRTAPNPPEPRTFMQGLKSKAAVGIPVVGATAGVYGVLQQQDNHRGYVGNIRQQWANQPSTGFKRRMNYHHGVRTPANPQGY